MEIFVLGGLELEEHALLYLYRYILKMIIPSAVIDCRMSELLSI